MRKFIRKTIHRLLAGIIITINRTIMSSVILVIGGQRILKEVLRPWQS
jgi:hypothetical protein